MNIIQSKSKNNELILLIKLNENEQSVVVLRKADDEFKVVLTRIYENKFATQQFDYACKIWLDNVPPYKLFEEGV